jgi:hypothetical protein
MRQAMNAFIAEANTSGSVGKTASEPLQLADVGELT